MWKIRGRCVYRAHDCNEGCKVESAQSVCDGNTQCSFYFHILLLAEAHAIASGRWQTVLNSVLQKINRLPTRADHPIDYP